MINIGPEGSPAVVYEVPVSGLYIVQLNITDTGTGALAVVGGEALVTSSSPSQRALVVFLNKGDELSYEGPTAELRLGCFGDTAE